MISLRPVLDDVWATLEGVSPPEAWAPTGCVGWSVHDLTWHMLADLRRGLVALHTPAERPATTDRVGYWQDWGVPEADAGAFDLRMGRLLASASDWETVRGTWRETAAALVHALEHTDPAGVVTTQGHALRVEDLAHTLAVEAALHHLDLVTHLHGPAAQGPSDEALALVREVLDALVRAEATRRGGDADEAGRTASLADRDWARLGTGRAEPTPSQREELGPVSDWLPLFA